MITGFNTDIKHGERIFHVQTEDRGLANPVVESLVYVGGEILLSKKSPYSDLVQGHQVDEKAVRQLMDLQHRRIIEAIRRGRFDGAKPGMPPPDLVVAPSEAAKVSPAAAAASAAILSSASSSSSALRPATAPVSRPSPPPSGSLARPSVGGGSGSERSLDQVIIEYLAAEAAVEHLEISLMKGAELVSGADVPLSIRAATSLTERPVPGAQVTVRVVSNVAPATVLFRGVTGGDGLVKVTCRLPDIGKGNGALIISANSRIGAAEIKQLLKRRDS